MLPVVELRRGMKRQLSPLDYWTQTALNAVKGAAIFATQAIASVVVCMVAQMGASSYDHLGAYVLIMTLFCMVGAIVGAMAGICLGFLFPVRNGPAFFTRQFPLKFSIVAAFFLLCYMGRFLK